MAGRRGPSLQKEEECGGLDEVLQTVCSWQECSADGVLVAGAFCRPVCSWQECSADRCAHGRRVRQTVIVTIAAQSVVGEERSETLVIVVERPRSWAVDFGS